jgi:hypothetical protein
MHLHVGVYVHAATHETLELRRFAVLSHEQRPGTLHLNMRFVGVGSVPEGAGMWYFYEDEMRYADVRAARLTDACNSRADWRAQL